MVQVMADFVGYKGSIHTFIKMACALDKNGVDAIVVSADLWAHDIFVLCGAFATHTQKIKLAFVTNPYSWLPALVARSAATLASLSNGCVRICFCAGGSFTLKPLDIPMWNKPVTRLREAIQICRQMLTGKSIDYHGKIFTLNNTHIDFPFPDETPGIFIAGRGLKIMALTGELADGAFIEPISTVYENKIMAIIEQEAYRHKRNPDEIIFNAPITYVQKTEEDFSKYVTIRIANALKDTLLYLLKMFEQDISRETMEKIIRIHNSPTPEAAIPFVTQDVSVLYRGMGNSTEQMLTIAEEKVRQVFRSIGVVIPQGEEKTVVESLSEDLVMAFHCIK
ncbi:MAG: LLM class flavin-dependent oxidoreductase [Candidatus Ranarchaeia archaeon]